MKTKYFRAASFVLILALLLSGCSATSKNESKGLKKSSVSYKTVQSAGEIIPSFKGIELWKKANENDYLVLYYREDNANICVFDKRSGSVWYSNPESGDLSNAAASQITLTTVSTKGVIKDYTSYADCVAKNQVEFKCGSSLEVTYTFGNVKPDLSSVPAQLTDKRFEEIEERIKNAKGNQRLLKRRYTKDKDGIWKRKTSLTKDQAQKLRELFEKIGYTEQELKKDTESAGAAAEEEQTSFSIPLKYTLEDDSLLVSVSGKETVYPTSDIITSLKILGYFGSLIENEKGYFFVPSGSGAIIDTSALSGEECSFELNNTDYTIPVERESGNDAKNLMPVFGISREKDGMLAIIEDNDGVASINVSKSGNVDEYNTVNASFAINTAENIGLSTDSVSKFYVTSKNHYEGNSSVRYIFLCGENNSYSGMALIYRDYLSRLQNRKSGTEKGNIPLFLETVGAVQGKASTLGFVHEKDIALTSFENDISVLKDMKKSGIKDVRLILSGWMNGGEEQKIADKVDVVAALGGEKGLAKLLKYSKDSGYTVYPKVLLNSFSDSDSIFTKNAYASKTLGSEKSVLYSYDKLTGNALDEAKRYILSPFKQKEVSGRLLDSLLKKQLKSVLIDDLSSTVYSDYKKNNEMLRQASLLQSGKIVSDFSGKTDGLMLTAPNTYTSAYSGIYTDVPMSSGSYKIFKCSVPFYQMVYHGYSDYSSSPLNFTADFRTNLLKCAEYGASPKFRFVYNKAAGLSPDEQTKYYAASYQRWKNDVIKAYDELNGLLSPVKASIMVKHSEIGKNVFRTDYDNGVCIYVNYNDSEVVADGLKIPALTAVRGEVK